MQQFQRAPLRGHRAVGGDSTSSGAERDTDPRCQRMTGAFYQEPQDQREFTHQRRLAEREDLRLKGRGENSR